MKRFVIIGNGGAALSALRAIRTVTATEPVTVISQEDCPAYSPALTTYYLRGKIPYRRMFLCSPGFYRRYRVAPLLGKRAVAIEPGQQRVVLEDGETVPYDRLLIATGSRHLLPPIPGREHALTLWTVREARLLKESTRKAKHIAIVGAGLIGLQILDALYQPGRRITLVEMLPQVLPRVLDRGASRMVETSLLKAGIALRLGETVAEISDEGSLKEIRLGSGERVKAEVVVLSTGVVPNTEVVVGSGVAVDQGVVVDESGRTNLEQIYAAGDVAQAPDCATGRSQVNATWPNALQGGWIAGLNMAGQPAARPHNVRANILTVLGLPLVSLGQVHPGAEDEESIRHADGSYRKLVFRRGQVVGTILVGEVAEVGLLASGMARGGFFPNGGSALLEYFRPLAGLYAPVPG